MFIKMFKIIYNYYILVTMNRKTFKRKTYKRKTYKRKTYKRKRGGNLLMKTSQVGQKIITNPTLKRNIISGVSDLGDGTFDMSKRIVVDAGKGSIQKNAPSGFKYVANYNSNPHLPTMPLSSGMGYYAPNTPPPNNYKITPPPSIEMLNT
jgi:hypothetical protein